MKWQRLWGSESSRTWTHKLISNIRRRATRQSGSVRYISPVLSLCPGTSALANISSFTSSSQTVTNEPNENHSGQHWARIGELVWNTRAVIWMSTDCVQKRSSTKCWGQKKAGRWFLYSLRETMRTRETIERRAPNNKVSRENILLVKI